MPLKRSGRNFKALCPFHAEKTPSFMVSGEKQIYKCFGCGKGGNAFHFLMEMDRLSFPEAVRMLAERVGVELPAARSASSSGGYRKEDLLKVMVFAAEFYHECLRSRPEGKPGRDYFAQRGVDTAVAQELRLGYAPEGWDTLLGAAEKKGFAPYPEPPQHSLSRTYTPSRNRNDPRRQSHSSPRESPRGKSLSRREPCSLKKAAFPAYSHTSACCHPARGRKILSPFPADQKQ